MLQNEERCELREHEQGCMACTCHVEPQCGAAAAFILDDVRSWIQRGQQLLMQRERYVEMGGACQGAQAQGR